MISGAATGAFVGNNVYSSVGTGEVRTVKVIRGHSVSAYVRVQNDGLLPASFKLTGAGSATGFSAHYYRGSTDITSAMRGGIYTLPALRARNSTVVRLVVRVARSSASAATFRTSTRSQTGTPPDAVRFVVKATT